LRSRHTDRRNFNDFLEQQRSGERGGERRAATEYVHRRIAGEKAGPASAEPQPFGRPSRDRVRGSFQIAADAAVKAVGNGGAEQQENRYRTAVGLNSSHMIRR